MGDFAVASLLNMPKLIKDAERLKKWVEGYNSQTMPTSREQRHRLFCFSVKEYAPENYVAWALLQTYRENPKTSEKKADFIYSVIVNRSSGEWKKYGVLTEELNITPNVLSETMKAYARSKTDEDVFGDLKKQIVANLSDTFSRFQFTKGSIKRTSDLDPHLRVLNQDLFVAGWHPPDLGLW